jgi:hypothetical protein
MPLQTGTINPLNVLGFRKINTCPAHFEKITVKETLDLSKIDSWIFNTLNSRYCIIKITNVDPYTNYICNMYEIGIEEPSELTMLLLSCPHIK